MYFEDIAQQLRDLLKPADVGATKVTTKAQDGAMDIEVDVNSANHTLAGSVGRRIDLIDGVTLTAKGTHAAELSADVETKDFLTNGLELKLSGLSKEGVANANAEAKFAIDAVAVTVESALSGGSDITASACLAVDDATTVGTQATVQVSSGGLVDWTIGAQRKDGPTTLSAAIANSGNSVECGVVSELDAKTTAGMRATLAMGGERNSLSFALAMSKKLSSGDVMRVVHNSHGDTDVTYSTSLCDGATATGCIRLANKGHHYKTGICVSMGDK